MNHSSTLFLLLGPQGSGKTTFARKHFPHVPRISQDEQGQGGHQFEFHQAVGKGKDILIDRINHRQEQRLRYALPAREAGYRIHYCWLDADIHTCLQRLSARAGHPTVHPAQDDHEKVLHNYFQNFEPPASDEYHRLEVLPVHDMAEVLDLRPHIGRARTWIIGDVHGCFDELNHLLEAGDYQPVEDVLIFTGDLVNRGPKAAEVLQFVRDTPRAWTVKGNHDERFGRFLAGRRLEPTSGLDQSLASIRHWTPEERENCRQWIDSWPYICRLPDLADKPFYVLHAGVDGRLPMDRQTQFHCLNARYFGGHDMFDRTSGYFWYRTLTGDRTIAFGHIPHPQVSRPSRWAISLDGGAAKGGVLRALIRSPEAPEGRILEVPGRPVPPAKS